LVTAPVDVEDCGGDEGCLVGGQERHGRGDVLDAAVALE
jgi:hypothetical protein